MSSDHSSDDILNRVSAIIKKNSIEVLEESPDFIGGGVENKGFTLRKSTGMARRTFPVELTARANDDGTWTVIFKTSVWWQWIWTGVLLLCGSYYSLYYSMLFFLPLIVVSYVFGMVAFNRDVRRLEKILETMIDLH